MKKKEDETNIRSLEKQYPDEWLLVEVTKEDSLGKPLEGKLLKHSPIKENILKSSSQTCDRDLALFYTGKIPKKGYAFCF